MRPVSQTRVTNGFGTKLSTRFFDRGLLIKFIFFCYSLDLDLSQEPMTGMVETNTPDNGDSTAMEGAGDGFISDLPNLTHDTQWTMDQVPDTIMENQQNLEQEQDQTATVEQHQQFAVDGPSELMAQKSGISEQSIEDQPNNTVHVPESQSETNGQTSESELTQKQAESGSSASPANMELEDASKEESEDGASDEQKPTLPSEFERLYKVVEENPEDFNGWVYLLQYVEQEVSITFSSDQIKSK